MIHCPACLVGTMQISRELIILSDIEGWSAFIEDVPVRVCTSCDTHQVCPIVQLEVRAILHQLEERHLAPKKANYLVVPGVIRVKHTCGVEENHGPEDIG